MWEEVWDRCKADGWIGENRLYYIGRCQYRLNKECCGVKGPQWVHIKGVRKDTEEASKKCWGIRHMYDLSAGHKWTCVLCGTWTDTPIFNREKGPNISGKVTFYFQVLCLLNKPKVSGNGKGIRGFKWENQLVSPPKQQNTLLSISTSWASLQVFFKLLSNITS